MAGEDDKRPRGTAGNLAELALTVAGAVLVVVLLQTFLVKPYKMPSASMAPSLRAGQRILVNRLDTAPGLDAVAVFYPPAGALRPHALCGDAGTGYRRRAPCDRPVPVKAPVPFVRRVVGLPGDRLRISGGRVWRNGVEEPTKYSQPCTDPSRCNFAQAITVPRGEYFMMGDNRGDSDDSRFWGPVPQSWIVGTAFLTYWPLGRLSTL